MDRRTFLQVTTTASGGLLLGVRLLPLAAARDSEPDEGLVHPLIRISRADGIVIYAKNPEIGQGSRTSLPMIVAEELEADWADVRVRQAELDERLENQFAGGSLGVLLGYDQLREAGAITRQMLIGAAAQVWSVAAEECEARNSWVHHTSSGRRLSFIELAGAAAGQPVPEKPPLKMQADFRIIGSSRHDVDARDIVSGKAIFGLDIVQPGQCVACIARAPRYGATVSEFDADSARAMPGIIKVLQMNPDAYGGRLLKPNSPGFRPGVAVIAETTWAAMRARDALRITWDETNASEESLEQLFEAFREGVSRPEVIPRSDGDPAGSLAQAKLRLESVYEVPFLAHVPMEPMNCTAAVTGKTCEIWAPTQNPEDVRECVAKVLGIPGRDVRVHMIRAGGGFGRRYYVDYAVEAALLSSRVGRPVKVVWTREDDLIHDFYRPAAVARLQGGLDAAGRVVAWDMTLCNSSRSAYLGRDDAPNGTEIDEYSFPAGLVENLRFGYRLVPSQVPVGQWRAVAPSKNLFFTSSFLDELAHLAGRDPIEFYLQFIGPARRAPVQGEFALDVGRLRKVVDKVRSQSGWGRVLPAGTGLGFAAAYTNTAFIAEVVQVRVSADNRLSVEKVWASVDCGPVINRQGAEAQIEGAIYEGLGAALRGRVTIRNGAPVETNFDRYRLLRLREAPPVELAFIGDDPRPRGLGEAGLPPLAPALCNAIFAATGKRIRRLPLAGQFKI